MEFEIESKEAYYKSYTDRIFVKDFFRERKQLIGSIVSGSQEYKYAGNASDFYFQKLNPRYKSGTNRFLNLNETKSVYYDSLMPEFTEIYKVNGGKLVRAWADEVAAALIGQSYLETPAKLLIGNFFSYANNSGKVYAITSSDGPNLSDTSWSSQYPFQISLRNIQRVENFNILPSPVSYYETLTLNGASFYDIEYEPSVTTIYTNKYRIAFYQGSNTLSRTPIDSTKYLVYAVTDATGSYNNGSDSFTNLNLKQNTDKEIRICFFGTDVNETSVVGSSTGHDYSYFPIFGMSCKGWKYGIYNGIPTNPKSIFRRNKYGMLAHKLESRLFSVIYNKETRTFYRPIDQIQFNTSSQDYLTASNQTLNVYDSGIYNDYYISGKPFEEI